MEVHSIGWLRTKVAVMIYAYILNNACKNILHHTHPYSYESKLPQNTYFSYGDYI